jgi:hypothetical protein
MSWYRIVGRVEAPPILTNSIADLLFDSVVGRPCGPHSQSLPGRPSRKRHNLTMALPRPGAEWTCTVFVARMETMMRITFLNLNRPKKAAKRLHALTAGISLSRCQAAVANACAYRDWHDLETQGLGEASALDQNLTLAERGERYVFQAERIARTLEIYYGDAKWALPRLHLSGDWSWDEYLILALPRARSGISVVSREDFAARRGFPMTALTFEDMGKWKEEGLMSLRWEGAPDRLDGAFPFPKEARGYITKVVDDFEAEDDGPVLQAAWRFNDGQSILVRLQYGYVEGNRIIESDPILLGPIGIDSLDWRPDPMTAIVPAKLSPSYFSDRPQITALL